MERKIRVGAVSYLNTKPLIWGFSQGMMKDEVDLRIDYPSNIAQMLTDNDIDVGLIPVAAIPLLKEYHIVSDYCISADSEVASVCLFAQVPLSEVRNILLDYQSKTSVALLKILCRDHWKVNPQYIEASPGYIEQIQGTTAGLIIGDRALQQRKNFNYIYDLASAWNEMTSMPFVFAAWVSNKVLPLNFIEDFNKANEAGLNNLEAVIAENTCDYCDLHEYYTKNISYNLSPEKKAALELFLQKLY